MTTETFNINEAIERLDELIDSSEPSPGLVGAVAADVERAFDELGRVVQNRSAMRDTMRLAQAVRETIATGGAPTAAQVDALREAAGDILNEVQRMRTSAEEREDELSKPAEDRNTSAFERRVSERRSKVKWARTPARRMQREPAEALTPEKIKAERYEAARQYAREKCISDGTSRNYDTYMAEALNDVSGSVLTGVALLGSETPARPLPDTRF